MNSFILGFAAGGWVVFALAMWSAAKVHREWMDICDRYEALLKKMKENQDPADWRKDN